MTATDSTTDRAEPDIGDVLYESESHERYAVVVATDPAGVTLRRNGGEQFVPHAMFAPWNDSSIALKPALADTTARRQPASHERMVEPAGAIRCRQS
jgi:hypothetical protein